MPSTRLHDGTEYQSGPGLGAGRWRVTCDVTGAKLLGEGWPQRGEADFVGLMAEILGPRLKGLHGFWFRTSLTEPVSREF